MYMYMYIGICSLHTSLCTYIIFIFKLCIPEILLKMKYITIIVYYPLTVRELKMNIVNNIDLFY